ncbi:error-prone DNA polymerase [Thioalkalivibrio paradoxus]|uniref:Error-prone DNA polymerase n=1 Tax=Thioalkalivibrio paradoxus ARh 1 TaxID=713585 RepID=W0DL43_9GAMM|nr:error-prone DNA polymerase [Thioalkalivibrio paradoxus]AHE97708.1 DNA polymerase [Thioalkalivibrio paradoxus ARh 1]
MNSIDAAPDAAPAGYAELTCRSNFSFLCGASHPEELVRQAAALGYRALALTDECSLAGIVRAHQAAVETGLHLIVGTDLRLCDGPRLTLLARSLAGYRTLCRLITHARRAGSKGRYRLRADDLLRPEWSGLPGCEVLWRIETRCEDPDAAFLRRDLDWAEWLGRAVSAQQLHLAVTLVRSPDDTLLRARAETLATASGIPVLACGDVLMHLRGRRALQDVLTALRRKSTVAEAAPALFPNGERCLRPRDELTRLYPAAWLAETLRVADRCRFHMDEVRYQYPTDAIPAGEQPGPWLRRLVEQGCLERWPEGTPEKVQAQLEHELAIIADLGYEPYFLTVHDIVRFARERGILCQGRGSAANSAVCYALGITAVDPARSNMLFERFISRERNEPPDIDVDFEHERREEVIQYLYRRYGRERAALTATVIRYRRRSALRDVGRALGISRARIDALTANMAWWDDGIPRERLQEVGLDPDGPLARQWQTLAQILRGFPRHLSQHTGGFVIAAGRLDELVPIENAAMAGRTVIQWDKDDLDALGLLKIDILALGMFSCLRRCLELLARHRNQHWGLADVPAEDPVVYAMLQQADTVGVFQIESRAQMSMLPRLQPETFYDLVIEIAIVRPGPIQGRMVHPYLRRRQKREPVTYPGPEVKRVLERTLGVPIFQEQVIELAMVAAGFSAGEADGLRRAIGAWRRTGNLAKYRDRLLDGMRKRGYPATFAEQIYQQILGFGEYGFPESHSASFALISYVSAWFKCREPAIFACALLNSQPMGFYAPAQIVADARRHGVEVRPIDVTASLADCSVEAVFSNTAGSPEGRGSARSDGSNRGGGQASAGNRSGNAGERREGRDLALRLGLSMVRGLHADSAKRIVAARVERPFRDSADLVIRARLDRAEATRLAQAGALARLAGNRHRARWDTQAVEPPLPLFPAAGVSRPAAVPMLPAPTIAEDLLQDYAGTGLTLGPHPLALLRGHPGLAGIPTAVELIAGGPRARVRYTGVVITRQRPGSAKGTVFLTLEDESGTVNVIVWPALVEKARAAVIHARLLEVTGVLQQEDGVTHLVAQRLRDRSAWLGTLAVRSRDFG